MYTCTFFGHRNAPSCLNKTLGTIIENLINDGVKTFLVGNNGKFDSYVLSNLRRLKIKYPEISYEIVLSKIPATRDLRYDVAETVLPDGIENTLPRFAINKRNLWMIKNSDVVISYVTSTGGAAKFTEIARKSGLKVINIAEML